jgi:phosphinothricin acetyltransferase
MEYKITPMQPEDWPAVREIYREGIATGQATFEVDLPAWEKWDAAHRKDCRLLARNAEQIFGWAALSPVSARRVYSGVAEVSVYVAASARGIGVGKRLLQALIEESERNEIWTLQAGIFPENTASVTLHKSCGFRELGVRRRIGKLREVWRDVLLLERRSLIAGQ